MPPGHESCRHREVAMSSSSSHVAIVVPFRDRLSNSEAFLKYMHNFLQAQGTVHYKIYFITQVGRSELMAPVQPACMQYVDVVRVYIINTTYHIINNLFPIKSFTDGLEFNRGVLFNIGYKMAMTDNPDWDCISLHDVDLLPVNITSPYKCYSKVRGGGGGGRVDFNAQKPLPITIM